MRQMLEEDYTLATEPTSKENEYGTRLKCRTWFSRMNGFANLRTILSAQVSTIMKASSSALSSNIGSIMILEAV